MSLLSNLSKFAHSASDDVTNFVTSNPDLFSAIIGGPGSPGGNTTTPGQYSAIYAFGDSLSDVGNISIATAGLVPVSPPYVGGQFSNGPVWVQDLAGALGLAPLKPSLAGGTDFAVGGATTGTTPAAAATVGDLPTQLADFEIQDPHPSPNALYTVWIGSNDLLDALDQAGATLQSVEATATAAVTNEVQFISSLAQHGARDFLVLNVPDLGVTPAEQDKGSATAALASQASQFYDQDLASSLLGLDANGALKIDLLNTYALIDSAVADPAAYGLTNVTQPLWSGSYLPPAHGTLAATGAVANGYLFFDSLHPTDTGHLLIAQAAEQLLGVPVA